MRPPFSYFGKNAKVLQKTANVPSALNRRQYRVALERFYAVSRRDAGARAPERVLGRSGESPRPDGFVGDLGGR